MAGVLLAGVALGRAMAGEEQSTIALQAGAGAEADAQAASPQDAEKEIIIRSIEPESGKQTEKEVTWLGVYVDEIPEALAAQLGLKSGQGLVVNFVSTDSPAAKAELQKNDVLVEFEGQMLVDTTQLRKLVQMHSEGDSVKVSFYRGGKKQTVAAKLVKKKWNESSLDDGSMQASLQKLQSQLHGLAGPDGLGEQMRDLAQSMARAGLDREKMKMDIEHTMEEARRAIEDAMRHSLDGQNKHKTLGSVSRELAELAGSGVDLGKDATVIIKNDDKSVKTIVKTDDSGSYVIVANPRKHLTAHDKDGKLLFDGAIESPKQQQKVPKEVWENVKPLLEQMEKGKMEAEEPSSEKIAPESQKP